MQSRVSLFHRAVTWIRTAGAVNTLWGFLKSPMAALYLWAPLLTLWGFIQGLREDVPTPYLLAASALIFGGVSWSAIQVGNLRDRFKERYQKLRIVYDRTVPSCRADVTFNDGSHSICFRLQVENQAASILHGCQAWLESTDRFPNISSVKLFWVSSPREEMAVDLINSVPRFLQICRITDQNRIIMATENEVWPIDTLKAFYPGRYVFNVVVKGEDNAKSSLYAAELNWTGNWTTAEMRPVAPS